jgi:hypothetical protein
MDNIGLKINDIMLHNIDTICVTPPAFPPLPPKCYYVDGHRYYATTSYTMAAIGNSWKDADNDFEDITYKSLLTYTEGME